MHLPMRRHQLALRTEQQRRVVVLLRRGHVFGDAAAEQVGFCFGGEGRERVESRRLGFGWGGGQQGFGVAGEVLAPVGRVEAFGEHN